MWNLWKNDKKNTLRKRETSVLLFISVWKLEIDESFKKWFIPHRFNTDFFVDPKSCFIFFFFFWPVSGRRRPCGPAVNANWQHLMACLWFVYIWFLVCLARPSVRQTGPRLDLWEILVKTTLGVCRHCLRGARTTGTAGWTQLVYWLHYSTDVGAPPHPPSPPNILT